MRILLAEDDPVLADGLSGILLRHGYAVDTVGDGRLADAALVAERFDLVLLDVQLPQLTGFELLARLRDRRDTTPVLVITARDALDDRIRGLDLGADDYLVKPFEPGELLARVRALLRRAAGAGDNVIELGRLAIDTAARRVRIDGQFVELTAREYAVLETLARRLDWVVSREQIAAGISGFDAPVNWNSIEVHVSRLRRKIEAADVEIRSVRGLGYMLVQRSG